MPADSRYWLLADRLLTSREMKAARISPLRAVDLGRHASLAAARTAAAAHLGLDMAAIIAANVRRACDSGRGARVGLAADQIARLRAGEVFRLEDDLGGFAIGYTSLEQT